MHVTWPRTRFWSDVNWPCDSFYRHRFTFHTDISAERTLAPNKSRARKLQQCVSRQKEGRERERERGRERKLGVEFRTRGERKVEGGGGSKRTGLRGEHCIYFFLPAFPHSEEKHFHKSALIYICEHNFLALAIKLRRCNAGYLPHHLVIYHLFHCHVSTASDDNRFSFS